MRIDTTTGVGLREGRPFIPRRSGERPVLCSKDGRVLATVVDFAGHLNVKCHACKGYQHWSSETGPIQSTTRRGMSPLRCVSCDGVLLLASRQFVGQVFTRCRTCRAENSSTGLGQRKRTMSDLDQDAFMVMMEERWLALFREFSRRRAEVAVGLRFDVFQRDMFRCRYCGRSADDGVVLHADHVIPQSKGGPTTLDNLVTACFECNIGKSNKDLGDIRPVI